MQQTYMRRHVMVKAIQYTGKNFFEVQTFINGRQPDIKSMYAGEKWDEYCQKCEKQGYIQVPSSLGYDPVYQRCAPNDWIVEPEPGVYNVMSNEMFQYQFRAMPTAEEIRDVSGVNALAEGYGPLKFAGLVSDRDADQNELTVDVLDQAAAVLNKLLGGGYEISEEQARKLATHRHYKGGLYYRLFNVRHSEREEDLVVYLHLWPHQPGGWARPIVLFEGENEAGQTRFEKLR
jgi:hypothetical protein